MEDVLAWLNDNGPMILACVGAAAIIANATPNETDNKVVAIISKVIDFLGANFNVKGLMNK